MLLKPLYQQGNTYEAVLLRQFVGEVFDVEGVIRPGAGSLLVTPRAAGANMSVDAAAGAAVVLGDDAANQGSYFAVSTAVENRPIGAAPGADSRIDLVVARVRDASVTGGVSSDWVIEVIPGAVAAVPVEPALPNSAIRLGAVLVAAGTLSIDAAKITDRRSPAANAAYLAKADAKAATTATAESTTATAMSDLATVGPAVTLDVPASGRVRITVSTLTACSVADGQSFMHVALSGATVRAAAILDAEALEIVNPAANKASALSRTFLLTGLAAGSTTFTAKYATAGGGSSTFAGRHLIVEPR